MKFKIAVVQMQVDSTSVENTFIKVEFFIKKASGKADIIVFPEYVIFWAFIDKYNLYRKHFQSLALKYNIDIVTGSMLVYKGKKLYNTMYYIDAKGKIKGTYRKINLWHPERPHLQAGNQVVVFDTTFGKIGLAICWDLVFPEMYRSMLKKGVQIVFTTAFWSNQDASVRGIKHNPHAESMLVDACTLSRACENEIIHVFCNAAGTVKDKKKFYTLTGHSQVCVPFKGPIGKLNHNKQEMFIAEVDSALLKDVEKAYKIRKDLML